MGRPKPSVVETAYSPSSLPPSHIIVQLGPPRGSSQFTSTCPEGTERLVELSPRLKRSGMLAQRGDFGVVGLYAIDPKAAAAGKAKGVEGEVVAVWTEKEVRGFKRNGEWCVSCPLHPPPCALGAAHRLAVSATYSGFTAPAGIDTRNMSSG